MGADLTAEEDAMPMPRIDSWTRRRFLARISATVAASWGGVMTLDAHVAHTAAAAANDLPRKGGTPFESHPGLDTIPGTLVTRDGTRLRTIVTRPAGARRPRPAILFVPWLSDGTIELPESANDGWSRMMKRVARESGLVMMRTDKRGVGDSEGGPCSRLDYLTELSDHRDALDHLARLEFVDRRRILVFGASMGANYAPLIAARQPVAGVFTWGGGARTWFERMLAFERNRRELSDLPADRINAEMKKVEAFLHAYLVAGKSPRRIVEEDAELGAVWSQLILGAAGDTHYGRPVAFHQQAQAQDWAAAWGEVDAPALVLYGEYDWFEDAGGAALAARIAARRHPKHTRFHIVPRTDHHFSSFERPEDAVTDRGGKADEGPAVEEILAWLEAVLPT
jgi:pimeloyl-ACP methyl ester carboxylesterase